MALFQMNSSFAYVPFAKDSHVMDQGFDFINTYQNSLYIWGRKQSDRNAQQTQRMNAATGLIHLQ